MTNSYQSVLKCVGSEQSRPRFFESDISLLLQARSQNEDMRGRLSRIYAESNIQDLSPPIKSDTELLVSRSFVAEYQPLNEMCLY